LKLELQLQRLTQKDLYKRLDTQRIILTERKTEQEKLLSDTRGQQSEYKKLVATLQRQFEAADAALLELFDRGAFQSIGKVKAGQQIGFMGSSGLSTGPHIHFAVFQGNTYVNPIAGPNQLINNYVWPVPNSTWADVSQEFGCTDLELEPRAPWCPQGYTHYGLDIAGWYGDPVVAVADGDIVFRGDRGDGYGNVVIIDHGGGVYTYYPHLLN